MKNLKIGHFTNDAAGTGLTVFLFEKPAIGAYLLCGSSIASLGLTSLQPDTTNSHLHALVFTGGSIFGLYSSAGVVQYLVEREVGLKLPHGFVPIVPTVAIYDLFYKKPDYPKSEDAYKACFSATTDFNLNVKNCGVGTGATIGKLLQAARRMRAGLGVSHLSLANGVEILAFAVVNAVGDVVDEKNHIIAGAKHLNGDFANCTASILEERNQREILGNTTLVAVFTNARFNRMELQRICKMAIAGMARAISPVFTCFDGDVLFAVSLGDKLMNVLTAGTMAAEVVRLAIIDAVTGAEVVKEA